MLPTIPRLTAAFPRRETETLFIRSPPQRRRKVSVRNFRGTVREMWPGPLYADRVPVSLSPALDINS
jgi:hypothetical protein